MTTLKWDDELTDLAIKNQTHKPWAVANPGDMLNATRMIADKVDGYPVASKKDLKSDVVGTIHFDFLETLKYLGFIDERAGVNGEPVYVASSEPRTPGFLTGVFLVEIIRAQGVHSPDALAVIGHNFILTARVSLEFCAALQRPGLTKDALKKRFENHLVFNNKLNEFKFPNLLKHLEKIEVIEEVDGLYRISHSPAPLTFYCMVERYLLDADYVVETRVNAADQVCYLDRLLPESSKRDMRFASLKLSKFPFEGWNKWDTWLTGSGFRELLQIGLIHPLSVAKVLTKLAADPSCESRDAVKRGLAQIIEKFVKDTVTKPVWDPPLEGLGVWRRVLGISKVADGQVDQTSLL